MHWVRMGMCALIVAGGCLVARVSNGEETYFQHKQGCFLLYNMKTDRYEKVIGEERCREQLSPCSTFKIPLAVMAFDAGVLKDEDQVLKWDGKKEMREVANHDHNARTWMRDSIVWFSKRLTPELGEKRVRQYLRDFHYGNEDMSEGLTTAWLVAPDREGPALKISAYEQVAFMKAFWTGALPVSARAMELTRSIMTTETSPKGFVLTGKTGSNFYHNDMKFRLGWFVAHLGNGRDAYLVVTNFTDLVPAEDTLPGGPEAREIMKKILGDQGLW